MRETRRAEAEGREDATDRPAEFTSDELAGLPSSPTALGRRSFTQGC